MHLPPVTIILLTWNGLALTQRCLASLRTQTRGVEYRITVVDNGSSDGTCAWLRAQSDLTLIENPANLGYVRGNNQAIAVTPPDHDLLLLNNDTEIVDPDWLAHLRSVAHSNPAYGIVGCRLLFPDGRLQHAGTSMPSDTFWGMQLGGGQVDIGQYPGVRVVEGVTGACMYIRADLRAAIGGLNEAFVSYYEDTDYCLRAAQAGFQTVCTAGTRVIHHENSSTKLNRADWRTLFSRGQQIFLEHWHRDYTERYHASLGWHGRTAGPYGSATLTRELLPALDRQGVAVCLNTTDSNGARHHHDAVHLKPMYGRLPHPDDPQVVCGTAEMFARNRGIRRIGFLIPDSETLAPEAAAQANRMDEIWVPGAWAEQIARECGVQRPIQIIPAGIDPDFLHPGIRGRRIDRRFVLLAHHTGGDCAALERLLRAYARAFRPGDDTLLLLRIFGIRHDPAAGAELRKQMQSATIAPVAVLIDQEVPAYQVGTIYRSADCFVAPACGGMNLSVLEAMACGLPVIAADCGAAREYMAGGYGFPVRTIGATPDEDQLSERLRYVYEHRTEARIVGQRAALTAAARTWDRAAEAVVNRLQVGA